MPIPLSGAERQFLSAITLLHRGYTQTEAVAAMRKTYSYLTRAECRAIVQSAAAQKRQIDMIRAGRIDQIQGPIGTSPGGVHG